ncbi:hypothetical protein GDO81_018459 [Engystomops pustulosus]|uniref:Uncharacterized protein n=1 Tax=Engystomops pustulosus TaxID=76066 RepID=A0AAV6ZPX9_ENGPU|nr:hypothetical protein GDO81_018459 [Engystomops pustulosus]
MYPQRISLHMEVLADIRALRAHIRTIPTREDMESYVSRLGQSYRSEMSTLKDEVHHIEGRVLTVETSQLAVEERLAAHSAHLASQSSQLQTLSDHLDDLENHGRRNNIRVRGLPESIEPSAIHSSLQGLFNLVLGVPADTPLELDHEHRSLGPKSPDPNRPRDIICRVHRYQLKESIMNCAREQGEIRFRGSSVQFLPDLSRLTLLKRKALHPLLDSLRRKSLQYSWGFPFRLQVRHNGRLHVLRHPGNLPTFADDLSLPLFDFLEWPTEVLGGHSDGSLWAPGPPSVETHHPLGVLRPAGLIVT